MAGFSPDCYSVYLTFANDNPRVNERAISIDMIAKDKQCTDTPNPICIGDKVKRYKESLAYKQKLTGYDLVKDVHTVTGIFRRGDLDYVQVYYQMTLESSHKKIDTYLVFAADDLAKTCLSTDEMLVLLPGERCISKYQKVFAREVLNANSVSVPVVQFEYEGHLYSWTIQEFENQFNPSEAESYCQSLGMRLPTAERSEEAGPSNEYGLAHKMGLMDVLDFDKQKMYATSTQVNEGYMVYRDYEYSWRRLFKKEPSELNQLTVRCVYREAI